MARPDILMVDGHAFSWRRLCELRRQQIEEWSKVEAREPALFELKTDCRPATERTATRRYAEPTFFTIAPARRARDDC